jgi:hypothetical protein
VSGWGLVMRGGLQGERSGGASWRGARIAEVDAELVRLGRGGAGLRLWLGEVLERLAVRQGHHELGFSSVGAYVTERCGLRERWVADTRAMARRLAELPAMRRALVRGEVSWSMAATLVPHVTRDSEAFLVGLAKRATVRQVRALFQGKEDGGTVEKSSDRRRIRRTMDREVAVLFEGMRQRVQMQVGTRASDAVWEALLAEGMTSLGEQVGDLPDAPRPDVGDGARSEPEPPRWVPPPLPPLQWELPEDVRGLDREAVRLSREWVRRDLVIGELTLELRELGGVRALGYASARQYWEERLGLGATSVKDRQTLVRRVSRFPALWHALEDGRIGLEAGRLLARMVTQETVEAWVAHAQRRTFKHLREEVEAAEVRARLDGGVPGPPGEGPLAVMADDPTAVKPRAMGRVTLDLWMSAELAALYRGLEGAWDAAGRPFGDFLAFLCVGFYRAWEHTYESDVAYAEIYARDGWECASPTCTRRDVTPHHIRFRSQGGGDEPDNVVALCSWCHLWGIHSVGAIKATGPATGMRWRTPVLEVRGREVTWRAVRA